MKVKAVLKDVGSVMYFILKGIFSLILAIAAFFIWANLMAKLLEDILTK